MPNIPHWLGGAWDRTRIGGKLLPGMTLDFKLSPTVTVNTSKAKGQDGPSTDVEGYEGAPGTMIQRVWGQAQLNALCAMLSDWLPNKPGAVYRPQSVEHPVATAVNASLFVVKTYTLGKPAQGKTYIDIPITLAPWFATPPKNTQTNPNPLTSGAPGGPGGNDGGPFGDGTVPEPDPANLGGDYP